MLKCVRRVLNEIGCFRRLNADREDHGHGSRSRITAASLVLAIIWPLTLAWERATLLHDTPYFRSDIHSQSLSDDKTEIVKFREMVDVGDTLYRDYMKSDHYLSRWLTATDNDLENSNTMLLKNLKWRKDNKIDTIMDEILMEHKLPPLVMNGTDYEGSTVVMLIGSRWDPRTTILQGKRDEFIRWCTQFMERLETSVLKRVQLLKNDTIDIDGPNTASDKAIFIVDVTDYSLKQHACLKCIGISTEVLQIQEGYYPAYMKHLIIINAPRIFKPLLEIMKPLMSTQTRNVLQLYGVNKTEWEDVLRKIVPLDQLGLIFT